jgi:hypothetical protein
MTDLDDVEVEDSLSPLEQAIGREGVEAYERALQQLKPEPVIAQDAAYAPAYAGLASAWADLSYTALGARRRSDT